MARNLEKGDGGPCRLGLTVFRPSRRSEPFIISIIITTISILIISFASLRSRPSAFAAGGARIIISVRNIIVLLLLLSISIIMVGVLRLGLRVQKCKMAWCSRMERRRRRAGWVPLLQICHMPTAS